MARKLHHLIAAMTVSTVAPAVPFNANAAILTSAPRETLVCGDAIELGIWYREDDESKPTPMRGRRVTMRAVDVETGRTWWRKTATATKKWRYWYLPSGRRGQCGTTKVTFTYRASGRKIVDRQTVRFRPED